MVDQRVDRVLLVPFCSILNFTKQLSPHVGVMTTAWTRLHGMSNGWATPLARNTQHRPISKTLIFYKGG